MLRHSVRSTIGLAASAALLALPAPAERPPGKKSVTEQVLEILRGQGTIDDSKYDALKRQLEEERARQQSAPRPGAREDRGRHDDPGTPDPEGWKVYFRTTCASSATTASTSSTSAA
jgi:hypothetical protein